MLPSNLMERAGRKGAASTSKPTERTLTGTLPSEADSVHIGFDIDLKKLATMRKGLPRPRVAKPGEVGIVEAVRRLRDGDE